MASPRPDLASNAGHVPAINLPGQGKLLEELVLFLDDFDAWTITPSLTLPHKGGEDKSLSPRRGKVRMGVKP